MTLVMPHPFVKYNNPVAMRLVLAGTLLFASGCGDALPADARTVAGGAAQGDLSSRSGKAGADSAGVTDVSRGESLANAGLGPGGRAYRVERTSSATTGALTGRITTDTPPSDSSVVPTHDLVACPRFVQRTFVSKDGGVGGTAVWLAGVASGPADDAPMRTTINLDDCQLTPRVQRIAVGGTLIVNSHDAVMSRLRFSENGSGGALRTTVTLNDAGQVVPTELAARSAGIVAIRDDLHPWVRGYLLVTPHPFVTITDDRGTFRFDRVPPGTYTLVTWHERFGTHTENVTVKGGGEESVELKLR